MTVSTYPSFASLWLVPRLARLVRDFDTVHWNPNWFVRGPERLDFAWR